MPDPKAREEMALLEPRCPDSPAHSPEPEGLCPPFLPPAILLPTPRASWEEYTGIPLRAVVELGSFAAISHWFPGILFYTALFGILKNRALVFCFLFL